MIYVDLTSISEVHYICVAIPFRVAIFPTRYPSPAIKQLGEARRGAGDKTKERKKHLLRFWLTLLSALLKDGRLRHIRSQNDCIS